METTTGNNFNFMNIGDESVIHNQQFELPGIGKINGKLFLKQLLNLTSMEVSINVMPAGAEVPFKHRHKTNEELYFFIRGQGEFEVDNETFPIKAGSMLRVSPNGVRTWRNTGSENLYYLVVQARADSMDINSIEDGELV